MAALHQQQGSRVLEATVTTGPRAQRVCAAEQQAGFTLIEVMISIVVLTVGLVSLLGVFAVALRATQSSQADMIAKQLASEAMESIFTARDTGQSQWSDIQNVANGGIFTDPAATQPINNAGADGIVGTADDTLAGAKVLTLPGPDGIVGTADDVIMPLTNYQRSIAITPVLDSANNPIPTLRQVTITIFYTTSQFRTQKTYVLSGYISAFR